MWNPFKKPALIPVVARLLYVIALRRRKDKKQLYDTDEKAFAKWVADSFQFRKASKETIAMAAAAVALQKAVEAWQKH